MEGNLSQRRAFADLGPEIKRSRPRATLLIPLHEVLAATGPEKLET